MTQRGASCDLCRRSEICEMRPTMESRAQPGAKGTFQVWRLSSPEVSTCRDIVEDARLPENKLATASHYESIFGASDVPLAVLTLTGAPTPSQNIPDGIS